MINENKFLVTWIEASGNVRGQATKLRADADRMFNHVCECGAQYAEIRKLGSVVKDFGAEPLGRGGN